MIEKKKKGLFSRFPDAIVIMIVLILLAAVLTYVVPAGEYTRVENEETGMMVVVSDTGAINALIGNQVGKSTNGTKGKLMIAGLCLLFAGLGATIGTFSEGLAFIPILMILMISLGYDAVVAVAIMIASACAGYGAAILNPFNVGLAQGIAGVEIGSGVGFRVVFFVAQIGLLIYYICHYAEKVKADPSKSLVKDIDYSDIALPKDVEAKPMTQRQKIIVGVFFVAIVTLVILMITLSLGFTQISSYFLLMGIIIGAIHGMHPNDMVQSFVRGGEKILYGALGVGIAWAISGLMSQGQILDSIVYYISLPLQFLPEYLSASLMIIVQAIINLFIPSGSGQAAVTMPIIAPLCDVLNISRQVGVLAFQIGDGFTNAVIPSMGITMAAIAIGKIPYTTWIKFMGKLFLMQIALGIVFCMVGVYIGF